MLIGLESEIGTMKGVLPMPDTGPFFQSEIDIGFTPDFLNFLQSKVGKDRKLAATHLLEDIKGTLTLNLEYSPVQLFKNGGKTGQDWTGMLPTSTKPLLILRNTRKSHHLAVDATVHDYTGF